MARLPIIKRFVRLEGQAMFDLVAGFCHSQVLQALVKLEVIDLLVERPLSTVELSRRCQVPIERIEVLLNAGSAIGLLKNRKGSWSVTIRGAALSGVPGLNEMIAHHDVLYRDLADPVAFFRGETETELADFWPYVFGAGAAEDPSLARRYSALMADSQKLVAQDTLSIASFGGVKTLMDVGGGTGAFLKELGDAHPAIRRTLFDLPAVVEHVSENGIQVCPGSFRDDPLPQGFDMITLVRVLYDHSDETVRGLLSAVKTALPVGGRILISEPMTGGGAPTRAGDAYFALYCMAMRTGKARSQAQVSELLVEAGFDDIRCHRAPRPYVTSVVEAVNPG